MFTFIFGVIAWLACGLIACWYGHAILDQGRHDTKGSSVAWMMALGPCTVLMVLFVSPFEFYDRFKDKVIFKRKVK